MSEFRELLEREAERFTLPPGSLERLHRRRLRRDKLEIGLLALVLTVAGTWLAAMFQGERSPSGPAAKPRIVDSFPIAAPPVALAVGERAVWIVSAADRTLIRLDPSTGKVVDEVSFAEDVGPPIEVAIWRGSVWVRTAGVSRPSSILPTVVRIDPATNRTKATFVLDHDTRTVAVGAGAVWAANAGSGTVRRRDFPRGQITVGGKGPVPPVAMAVGEGGVWTLGQSRVDVQTGPPVTGEIARIDPRTGSLTSSTEVGRNPQDLAVGRGAVWVVSAADGMVFRIDPATVRVTDRIPITGLSNQITVGPTGVWVLDRSGGMLSRIDPDRRQVTGSVKVGTEAVAVASAHGGVWVTRADGRILRISG